MSVILNMSIFERIHIETDTVKAKRNTSSNDIIEAVPSCIVEVTCPAGIVLILSHGENGRP